MSITIHRSPDRPFMMRREYIEKSDSLEMMGLLAILEYFHEYFGPPTIKQIMNLTGLSHDKISEMMNNLMISEFFEQPQAWEHNELHKI